MKPHKGRITNWSKEYIPNCEGLGYIINGTCNSHPNFETNKWFHTSWVVSFTGPAEGETTSEIETKNSRYTLVGEEVR